MPVLFIWPFDELHVACNAESEAKGVGRHKAELGQWYRLHGHSKTGHDAAIVRLATAMLDSDIRRSMYKHPWLSHDKYRGKHCTLCISAGSLKHMLQDTKAFLRQHNTSTLCPSCSAVTQFHQVVVH